MKIFHLKRCGPERTKEEAANYICFHKNVTVIGRNPGQVDFVLTSSNYMQNAVISRRHARVVKKKSDCFTIFDDSRNGVFVNDIKIEGSQVLNEGDVVTFGHLNGESVPFGTRSRQPDSEYQFMFEECCCSDRNTTQVNTTQTQNKIKLREKCELPQQESKFSATGDHTTEKVDETTTPKKVEKETVTLEVKQDAAMQSSVKVQCDQDISADINESNEEESPDKSMSQKKQATGDECEDTSILNNLEYNSDDVSASSLLRNTATPMKMNELRQKSESEGALETLPEIVKSMIDELAEKSCESGQQQASPVKRSSDQIMTDLNSDQNVAERNLHFSQLQDKSAQQCDEIANKPKVVNNSTTPVEQNNESTQISELVNDIEYLKTSPMTTKSVPDARPESVDGEVSEQKEAESEALNKPIIGCHNQAGSMDWNKTNEQGLKVFDKTENARTKKIKDMEVSDAARIEFTKVSFPDTLEQVQSDQEAIKSENQQLLNEMEKHIEKCKEEGLPINIDQMISMCGESSGLTMLEPHVNTYLNITMTSVDKMDDGIPDISTDVVSESFPKDPDVDVTRIENTIDTLCDLQHSPRMVHEAGEKDRTEDRMSPVNDKTLTEISLKESQLSMDKISNNELDECNMEQTVAEDTDNFGSCGIKDQQTFDSIENPLLTSSPAHSNFNSLSLGFSGKRKLSAESVFVTEEHIKDALAANVGATVLRLKDTGETSTETQRPGKRLKGNEETPKDADFVRPVQLDGKISRENKSTVELEAHQFSDADFSDSENGFSQKSAASVTETESCLPKVTTEQLLTLNMFNRKVETDGEQPKEGTGIIDVNLTTKENNCVELNSEVTPEIKPNIEKEDIERRACDSEEKRDIHDIAGEENQKNYFSTGNESMKLCESMRDQDGTCNKETAKSSSHAKLDNTENETSERIDHNERKVTSGVAEAALLGETYLNEDQVSEQSQSSEQNDCRSSDNSEIMAIENTCEDQMVENNDRDTAPISSGDNIDKMDVLDDGTEMFCKETIDAETHKAAEMENIDSSKRREERAVKLRTVLQAFLSQIHEENLEMDDGARSVDMEPTVVRDPSVAEPSVDMEISLGREPIVDGELSVAMEICVAREPSIDRESSVDRELLSMNQLKTASDMQLHNLEAKVESLIQNKLLKYRGDKIHENLTRYLAEYQQDFSESEFGQFKPLLEINFELLHTDAPSSDGENDSEDAVAEVKLESNMFVDDCLTLSQDDPVESDSSGSMEQVKLNSSTLSQSQNLCLFLDFAENTDIAETQCSKDESENGSTLKMPCALRENQSKENGELPVGAEQSELAPSGKQPMPAEDISGSERSAKDSAKSNNTENDRQMNSDVMSITNEDGEISFSQTGCFHVKDNCTTDNQETLKEGEPDTNNKANVSPDVVNEVVQPLHHLKEPDSDGIKESDPGKCGLSSPITDNNLRNTEMIISLNEFEIPAEAKEDKGDINLDMDMESSSTKCTDIEISLKEYPDRVSSDQACSDEATKKRNADSSFEDLVGKRIKISTGSEDDFTVSEKVYGCKSNDDKEVVDLPEVKEFTLTDSNIDTESLSIEPTTMVFISERELETKQMNEDIPSDTANNIVEANDKDSCVNKLSQISHSSHVSNFVAQDGMKECNIVDQRDQTEIASCEAHDKSLEEFTLHMELSQFPESKTQDHVNGENEPDDVTTCISPCNLSTEPDDDESCTFDTPCVPSSCGPISGRACMDSINTEKSTTQCEDLRPQNCDSFTSERHCNLSTEPDDDESCTFDTPCVPSCGPTPGRACMDRINTEKSTTQFEDLSLQNCDYLTSERHYNLSTEPDDDESCTFDTPCQQDCESLTNQTANYEECGSEEGCYVEDYEKKLERSGSPEFDLPGSVVNTDALDESSKSSIDTNIADISEPGSVVTENIAVGQEDQCGKDFSQDIFQSLNPILCIEGELEMQTVGAECTISSELIGSCSDRHDSSAHVSNLSDNYKGNHNFILTDQVVIEESSSAAPAGGDISTELSQDISEETASEIISDTEDNDDETNKEGHFVPETQDGDSMSRENTREKGLMLLAGDLPYLKLPAERNVASESSKGSIVIDMSQEIPFCPESNTEKSKLLENVLELSCQFSSDSEIEVDVPDFTEDATFNAKEPENIEKQNNFGGKLVTVEDTSETFRKEYQDESDVALETTCQKEILSCVETIEERIAISGQSEKQDPEECLKETLAVQHREEAEHEEENRNDSLKITVTDDYLEDNLNVNSDNEGSVKSVTEELTEIGCINDGQSDFTGIVENDTKEKWKREYSSSSLMSGVGQLQSSDEEECDGQTEVKPSPHHVKRETQNEVDLLSATDTGQECVTESKKRKYSPEHGGEESVKRERVSVKQEESAGKLGSVLERIMKKRNRRLSSDSGQEESPPHNSAQSSQEILDSSCSSTSAAFSTDLPDVDDNNIARAELHARRASEMLADMEHLFNEKAEILVGNPRLEAWKKDLCDLKIKQDLPKTIIAVVGDTGCGKSSLVNALLDHADILPTSGMRACTAVVVEIVANLEDDSYRADIDFLSEKEWVDELQLLLNELRGQDGLVKARPPDPQSEAGVAWSKIRAVYGVFHDGVTVEQLTKKKNVTYLLGRTKNISQSSAKQLTQNVNHYIEARETGDGGDYWPIVKHVTLRIPRCRVLSSGTVLVDLPGIRDSNAARDKIAKDFLKDCTAVWVVASVHRAVDDRTAKELLGVHFRRQLLMDGQYGSVSFVCTKTDQIQSSEIVRSLKLANEVEPIEISIGKMTSERLDTVEEVKDMGRRVKKLDKILETAEAERADFQKDVRDLEEGLKELEDCATDEQRATAEEQLEQLRTVISENERECEEYRQTGKQLRIDKRNKEKTLLELEKKVTQKMREVAVVCAKARNEYTKTEIRRDFRAGLREMRRQANLESDSDSDHNDEQVEEDGATYEGEFGLSVENLKVFCVSATDYLKLKGKLPKDGPPQTFSKAADTGIPELQSFVRELTRVRKIQGTQRLLRIVGQFVSDVLSYLCDEGTSDKLTRGHTYKVFEKHITDLRDNSLRKVLVSVQSDLNNIFNTSISVKTREGAKIATAKALETATRWGSKQNREKPREGGLHFSTYRAVVRRDGAYKSASFGPVDFNEDLAGPIYTTLTITWDRVFNLKLHQILDRCRHTIISSMKRFAMQLRQEMLQLGVSTERVDRVYVQQLSSATNKLIDTNNELKAYVTEKQRQISRTITPSVQQSMLGAYDLCQDERGPGCFNRMKGHMTGHIEQHKNLMFDEASTEMLDQMLQLFTEILVKLHSVVESLLKDLTTLYEPLWEAPVNTKMLRDTLMPRILECNQAMEGLLQEAGVELEHKSGDEADLFASQQSKEILHNSLSNRTTKIGQNSRPAELQNIPVNRPVEMIHPNSIQQDVLVYDREKQGNQSGNKGKTIKSTDTSEGNHSIVKSETHSNIRTMSQQKERSGSGIYSISVTQVQACRVKVEKVDSVEKTKDSSLLSEAKAVPCSSNTGHVNTQIGTPSFSDTVVRPPSSRLSSSYKKRKLDGSYKTKEATVSRPRESSCSNSSWETTKNAPENSSKSISSGVMSDLSPALTDKTNVNDRSPYVKKVSHLQTEQQRVIAKSPINKGQYAGTGLHAKPQKFGIKVYGESMQGIGSSEGGERVRVKSEPRSPSSSSKRKKPKTYELIDLTGTSEDEDLPPMKKFLGQ